MKVLILMIIFIVAMNWMYEYSHPLALFVMLIAGVYAINDSFS